MTKIWTKFLSFNLISYNEENVLVRIHTQIWAIWQYGQFAPKYGHQSRTGQSWMKTGDECWCWPPVTLRKSELTSIRTILETFIQFFYDITACNNGSGELYCVMSGYARGRQDHNFRALT